MRIVLAALLFCSAAIAQPRPRGPHMNEADQTALSTYELTADHVKRALAIGGKINSLPPEKRPPMRGPREANGLDGTVKMMEENADFAKLLKSEGISARDYLLTTIAMTQAVMMNVMRERHPEMTQMPPDVNPKNVEWVQKHQSEAKAWQDAMQQMRRDHAMHGPPGGEEGPAK